MAATGPISSSTAVRLARGEAMRRSLEPKRLDRHEAESRFEALLAGVGISELAKSVNSVGGLGSMLYQASTWVLPVVLAITFHEAAHGFIAYRFGDDTAWRAGRVTFNPLKHIDRFGTIICRPS